MIIGIVTAFALLIMAFKGPQADLLIMHGEKHVKKEVKDKTRRDNILSEYKNIKQLKKNYTKANKVSTKQLAALISDYGTDRNTFDDFFEKLEEEERKINEQFFTHRINIQQGFEQAEWDKVMDDIRKAVSKDEKASEKIFAAFDKHMAKMKASVSSAFDDSADKKKAEAAVDKFIASARKAGKAIVESSPEEKAVLQKREATRAELEEIGDRVIGDWKELLHAFADLNGELNEIATEEQWKSIAKALKKL